MTYSRWLVALTAVLTSSAALADPSVNVSGSDGNANLTFLGDTSRLGVGIDDEGDWFGEYFHVFGSGESSNWIGEVWANDEEAGGLKLNYHWLQGASDARDSAGNDDVWVGKLFLAADQNSEQDRKASLGFGMERPTLFWSLYLMKSLTDERLVGQTSATTVEQLSGIDGNIVFVQDQFTTDTLRVFEHPYERGVGVRLGRYFDDGLWRLRGGLDYEEGDFNSDQLTVSLGLEKFFSDSGHSLALGAEHYERDGDFVLDDSDTRATLTWRYNFGAGTPGRAYRARHQFDERQLVTQVPGRDAVTRRELVSNEVTVGETTLFDLDKSAIKPASAELLDALWRQISALEIASPIEIVGHTCDLGTDAYNQRLSEARAQAVVDYLVSRGAERDKLRWRGAGETQPRYPNTDEQRSRNRRVEINFVSSEPQYRDVIVEPAVAASTKTEIVREPLANVSWVSRALRNPVAHKRTVDVYRFEQTSQEVTLGDRVTVDLLPSAVDDSASTGFGQAVVIAVLANDSDPDGGPLTLISVGAAANGTASANGDGTVTYTPNAGFFGTDQFDYTVRDSFGSEASATVTVDVDELPFIVASDDADSTGRNQPIDIDVLANDTGDAVTVTAVSDPANGTVTLSGGVIRYTPDRDFVGTDTFTYTITDSINQTDTASVTVTVNPFNQAPVANDDTGTTAKDTSVLLDVLANDSDPDGDALTIVAVSAFDTGLGTIEIVGDRIRYTPHAGWWGGDEFTYTIEDGFGGSATATVVLDVTNSTRWD